MQSALRICLFGSLNIHRGEIREQVKLTRNTQELLAYLLVFRRRMHPREVLANVFWKDIPQERARNCLNTAVWRLRRVLEGGGVTPGTYVMSNPSGELGFNLDSDVWLDVDVFEREIHKILARPPEKADQAEIVLLEGAVKLYAGDLLEGHYCEWALRERERLRCCYLDCLYYLMRCYSSSADIVRALAYGQEILRADPLREDVHRQMMRLFDAGGQRSGAVRQFHLCREILRAELGIPPMPETLALFREMTGSESAPDGDPPPAWNIRCAMEKITLAMKDVGCAQENLKQALEQFQRSADPAGAGEKRFRDGTRSAVD
jgi:DNA-binding SARP family transcriptional activator